MLPRKSALLRPLGVVTFITVSLWVWIETADEAPRQTWIDGVPIEVDSDGLPRIARDTFPQASNQFQLVRNESYDHENKTAVKLTHHHSNQSLEVLRKNMTLLKVNLSGILDRIQEANKSWQFVLHGAEQHINVTNPHNFNYILNTKRVCSDKDIFVIIYVHTAPSHYKRRMVIRDTWGNSKYYNDVKVRLVFVMGKVEEDIEAQKALEFEHEQYGDIVQEDFKDTYKNLTYKGIGALKWISTYCSHAKFVLKTDDDIFVNMFTMLRHLKSVYKLGNHKQLMLMCLVWTRMKVMREGKWKISKDEFKDDYYPTYCSGSAFAMTVDTAIRLHEVSYHVPFFWVDDFYITGLLPIKAGNVSHKQLMSTYVLDGRKLEDKFTGPQWFTYIFSHVHNLNLVQSVWERLVHLARGEVAAEVKFALPGQLPDEKEIRRKSEQEAKKKLEEAKKKEEEKKKKQQKSVELLKQQAKLKKS